MNTIYYVLMAYEFISWICIAISLRNAPTDVELWNEEIE